MSLEAPGHKSENEIAREELELEKQRIREVIDWLIIATEAALYPHIFQPKHGESFLIYIS